MRLVLKKEVKELLSELEFAGVFDYGSTYANALQKDWTAFSSWIENKYQGEMNFLEKNEEVRKNLNLILPEVRSGICFLFPYSLGHRVRIRGQKAADVQKQGPFLSRVARYARGQKDYHQVAKELMTSIGESLKVLYGPQTTYRAVVDSVPFFDRAHAREAGLGFVGKNTLLIRPGIGSFFFIGTLLTNLPALQIAQEEKNPFYTLDCGSCQKCLQACPTQAFEAPYVLNATKCLAYHSIEQRKDTIPDEYIPHFKEFLFGCDICQEVCPYNYVTENISLIDRLKKNLGVDYFETKNEKVLTYKQVEKLVIYFQNHFHVRMKKIKIFAIFYKFKSNNKFIKSFQIY